MKKAKPSAKTIQVALRVRPPNSSEEGHNCDYMEIDKAGGLVDLREQRRPFQFHQVYDADTSQEAVFEGIAKQAVVDALDGYHGLLFCYGQTGTGKTYTMSNQEKGKEGILQRSLRMIFERVAEDTVAEYEIHVEFIQIYKEDVQDLIGEPSAHKDLPIRPVGDGLVRIEGATQELIYRSKRKDGMPDKPIDGVKRAMAAFHKGDSLRNTATTKMNPVSSRSHTVYTLFIQRRELMTEADYGEGSGGTGQVLRGRLILVDLAGSERQKKTGAEGIRLAEASSINRSLLVLGKVVQALTAPPQHVPYRESKLTRILQYSLEGHGKTSIIVNCGPSEANRDETRTAMLFGQRAMTIEQHAQLHQELDYKKEYFKLKGKLDERADELFANQVEELQREHAIEIEERNDVVRNLETKIRLLEADGRGASPVPGTASPGRRPSAESGDGSDQARRYKNRLLELEKSWEDLQREKDKQNRTLLKAAKERKCLADEVALQKRELDKAKSEHSQIVFQLTQQLRQRENRIDGLLTVIQRIRKKADQSTFLAESPDQEEPDTVSPRDEHIDPHLTEDMSADEQIARLMACVSKLRDQRRDQALKAEELLSRHDKARKAIRMQAQEKLDSVAREEELSSKLEASEARKRALQNALSQLQDRLGS